MPRPVRFRGAPLHFWILALAIVAAAAAGCRPRSASERRLGDLPRGVRAEDLNVLLATLDTPRADRIGVYGRKAGTRAAETPVIDALAAKGAMFENAASVMPLTLGAHSTMMTGLLPAAHGVRDNGGFR